MDKKKKRRLAAATVECLNILGSLMRSYEVGDSSLYIPMAAQLRILMCDTLRKKDHSLLGRLLPDLSVRAFRRIEFLGDGPLQFAPLPFEISKNARGLILADFQLSHPPKFISLRNWREQVVTLLPCKLTVHQIVRTICDKGGGAHVDDEDGFELGAMRRSGPTDGGIHIPFTIATARYALHVGDTILKHHSKEWGIDSWRFQPPSGPPAGHWEWEIKVHKS